MIYASQKNGSISLPVCSPLHRVRYAEWEMMILDWTFAGLSKEEIIDRLAKILLEHKEERSRIQAVSLLKDVLIKGDSQKDVEELLEALLPSGRRDQKFIEDLLAKDRRGVRYQSLKCLHESHEGPQCAGASPCTEKYSFGVGQTEFFSRIYLSECQGSQLKGAPRII